ncbi:transcriptional repressor LexA [Apilactobacillus micheneri]|uniref:LexA repressor n=1 Tax=Apilactobacillus micheneri TaxID=1899430 RepID=A0ABY2YYL6_9LACO|nr:transcriptional repressor LexA [Apilactobacillus micheneri]TPR25685.1 transcriptional repressor LexA [Apilactobacillus micheneri]TPR26789.1 transcriptional repressor LexA [Apilactobacillus micheneri]TPR28577.1 transcriptional repressor LexA [Apilactobacillus micheneri]TPR29264.1 transcriptional repressor LexA [Apilactobacillus micheneri]TPR30852.1 transcriptional repressor LexA [Apilactobacillus micheneri]
MTLPKDKVSSKQINILKFIWNSINNQGYPPTVREIAKEMGLASTSTVHGYLSRLSQKGLLIKNNAKPRAIEITEDGLKQLGVNFHSNQIPILGNVAAGEPILAVENSNEYFSLPDQYNNDSDIFMLNIKGESMVNIGIFNNDKVIVKKQSIAENGDIVIAMNDKSEATCKRFFKESDHYRLQPENDYMSPIILDNVKILGKVIGLYRDNIS